MARTRTEEASGFIAAVNRGLMEDSHSSGLSVLPQMVLISGDNNVCFRRVVAELISVLPDGAPGISSGASGDGDGESIFISVGGLAGEVESSGASGDGDGETISISVGGLAGEVESTGASDDGEGESISTSGEGEGESVAGALAGASGDSEGELVVGALVGEMESAGAPGDGEGESISISVGELAGIAIMFSTSGPGAGEEDGDSEGGETESRDLAT